MPESGLVGQQKQEQMLDLRTGGAGGSEGSEGVEGCHVATRAPPADPGPASSCRASMQSLSRAAAAGPWPLLARKWLQAGGSETARAGCQREWRIWYARHAQRKASGGRSLSMVGAF